MLASAAMQVIISSQNPVKIAATKAAFAQVFPGVATQFLSVDAASGVSEQPDSDQESRQGATNRVNHARQMHPHGDFWVGLEGGLEWIDGEPLASAWMVISNAQGRISQARTPTLPLPPAVKTLLLQGMELGEANDRVFATRNSKQAGGAYGLLTGGLMTRESVYTQTLILALLPFSHPMWTGEAGSGQTASQ